MPYPATTETVNPNGMVMMYHVRYDEWCGGRGHNILDPRLCQAKKMTCSVFLFNRAFTLMSIHSPLNNGDISFKRDVLIESYLAAGTRQAILL